MGLLYSHFVRGEMIPLVIGAALCLSCGRQPRVYAMPEQKSLDLGADPGGLTNFIRMDDPQAEDYIVKDISPERGLRRWAFVRPELRFRVNQASHLKFAAEFAIPEVTYKVTGPVTVSAAVNGKPVGSVRCDHPGDFVVEGAVPEGVVDPRQAVHVTFEATPRWISPDDHAELSFLLRSAGFTQ